ncbi:uncharacterized protein HMPREF1541_08550 [Cyphellophora europaea CBS 101466]|uniref:Uncharacterized protein n=1 Tax=Cyphellophora europaea (strain CBS 101466) TaxID=1220924 RepID=W2RKN0_CYPE1|nr:uncharacterized protein HMPREF1541_08550 [Cyphellophora europaea CBS 101466]ETN36273.1 hypothetical protein HMPREF1541_08550 [Cyphellophora europaea CBS 101466]
MSEPLPVSYDNEPQFQAPDPLAHPVLVPDTGLNGLLHEHIPSLVVRDSSSSSSASSSSATGEKSSGGSSITTPVVVGTIVPLAIAVVIMIFLHRRHVKKLRQEDAEDKHGSLDFGLGEGRRPQQTKSKRWKKQPPLPPPEMSMSDAHNALRKERGMSIDMGHSPYLLPPGLQHSRESLHSMSRSQHLNDDKYQRTDFIPDDGSIRSPTVRNHGDDSSSFSGSTRFRNDTDSSRSLIHAAHGLPARPNPPPKAYSPIPAERTTSPNPTSLLAPAPAQDTRESIVSTTGNTAAFRASNDYLGAFIRGGSKPDTEKEALNQDPKVQPQVTVTERETAETPESQKTFAPVPMPAIVMNEPPLEHARMSSDYTIPNQPAPEPKEEPQRPARTTSMPLDREPQLPQFNVMDFDSQSTTPRDQSREMSMHGGQNSQGWTPEDRSRETSTYGDHQQPSTTHSRDQSNAQAHQQYDDASDYYDPEDTYSVYGDYEDELGYDPRRLTWGVRPLPPDDPAENPEQRANRIRSFYKEYFDESSKPGGGNVAQYFDGSEDFYDDYYEQDYYPPRGMSAAGAPRHRAMSNNSHMRHGPRAFSSASARYAMPPRGGPRQPPKKRAPPPKALNELPTPHKLKDDTFLIDMAVDFAPPDKARFQRSGTPSSPRGGQRPFSPNVRAFTPLQSSYDDLAVLPSPHLLRKSGTFTGLDFAPPGRIHVPGDSASDAGSIRSARSGISRMHEHSIRTGAYRVSRIPREVAGTRDEISDALKPTMDIGRK